jgi:hypothetical protein
LRHSFWGSPQQRKKVVSNIFDKKIAKKQLITLAISWHILREIPRTGVGLGRGK